MISFVVLCSSMEKKICVAHQTDAKLSFVEASRRYIAVKNWDGLKILVESYYRELVTNRRACEISIEIADNVVDVVNLINTQFSWYNSLLIPFPIILTEVIRILRVLVTDVTIARYLINDAKFIDAILLLMTCIFTKKNEHELCTKYLLHLMVNLLTMGKCIQDEIFIEQIFKYFYSKLLYYFSQGYTFIYEISAVMHNLHIARPIQDLELINTIIVTYNNGAQNSEYLDFLFEKVIVEGELWLIFLELPIKSRLIVLSYINEILVALNNSLKLDFSQNALKLLVQMYNDSAKVVFQVAQQDCEHASQEVAYILQILSVLSGNEQYLSSLQQETDLFINSGVLLINLHQLGKSGDILFKPVQKLSELTNPSNNIADSPVFGFKASLIRLIGNLCWKNTRMQDLARTAELIPVILDCCNIDAKNPFIMQWVILAIRNICENNLPNQSLIAGLSQQGVVSSQVLQDFGISSYTEDLLNRRFANIHIGSSNVQNDR